MRPDKAASFGSARDDPRLHSLENGFEGMAVCWILVVQKENAMPAYVISMMAIHDPGTYRKYTALTPPTVKRHGGRFLTRGDVVSTIEGDTFTDRMVILEFPTKADVDAWMSDPEYVAAAEFRHASSVARILVQEGRANTEDPDPKV
jgi:uncharacterized protein (DUF1330 family)